MAFFSNFSGFSPYNRHDGGATTGVGATSGVTGSNIPQFSPTGSSGIYPNFSNPADTYEQNILNLSKNLNPYRKIGFGSEGMLMGLGMHQMLNPAGTENKLAASFTNSPYQNQIQQNTANQMNMNAANTGMLGSTAQDAALQNQMAQNENQWQQQYVDRGQSQYDMGLQDLNKFGMAGMQEGYNATNQIDTMGQQAYMAPLRASEMQQMMNAKEASSLFGDVTGMIGNIL